MKRDRSKFLVNWLCSDSRKPLVIRGARQTGKTWLVRELAQSQHKHLIELNFEKRPELESLFRSNDPKEILLHIGATFGASIETETFLLFLDEIQAAPHILGKLRWFAEELPELPVIAAGSLLDFALADHEFSMPVGRISYMYLEPLSFEEFLTALGEDRLREYLKNYHWSLEIPEVIHEALMNKIKEYLIIGGMPAAVASWIRKKAPEAVHQIHFDLLSTYRDDFAKYRGRLSIERIEDIFQSAPKQIGRKFVFRAANPDTNTPPLKQALSLLSKARVCHQILATAGNGLPLGAEVNEKYFKVILLDCGLCAASLGLSLHQLQTVTDLSMINNGGMAEQLVGQLLRTVPPAYLSPTLYCWGREKKGSEAEVDYIIQHENQVLPVEVKAGTTGTLKSLHEYMSKKNRKLAIRINSGKPNITQIEIKDSAGAPTSYKLLSLPFYLIGQIHRLITLS